MTTVFLSFLGAFIEYEGVHIFHIWSALHSVVFNLVWLEIQTCVPVFRQSITLTTLVLPELHFTTLS
jgi:hypothetical protein